MEYHNIHTICACDEQVVFVLNCRGITSSDSCDLDRIHVFSLQSHLVPS